MFWTVHMSVKSSKVQNASEGQEALKYHKEHPICF